MTASGLDERPYDSLQASGQQARYSGAHALRAASRADHGRGRAEPSRQVTSGPKQMICVLCFYGRGAQLARADLAGWSIRIVQALAACAWPERAASHARDYKLRSTWLKV